MALIRGGSQQGKCEVQGEMKLKINLWWLFQMKFTRYAGDSLPLFVSQAMWNALKILVISA